MDRRRKRTVPNTPDGSAVSGETTVASRRAEPTHVGEIRVAAAEWGCTAGLSILCLLNPLARRPSDIVGTAGRGTARTWGFTVAMAGSPPEQRPQPLPEASVRDGVDGGVQRPNSAPSLCLKLLYAMV
ncbi:Hypp4462 [Branchiostoma lanceolatum]|uniref:Hypp4462 protein n=1 Tax=Branchiostoma lanceolatum TaxID=7740 RepID=A0A8K0AAH3_BRALA|nr:Hypp4462 [Branchiostoma lanceolatum]